MPAEATAFPPKPSAEAFLARPQKSIALFGMSGVGKTWIARHLRDTGAWFHYSVDYRIGTRYLGERIVDDFKREAMKSPLLRDMLRSDSIFISSNITFENLKPLSTWLGKPGAASAGGLAFEDYVARQRLHRDAEIASMRDAMDFASKADEIYGYSHFLCDTSGSLVEVVDPWDPNDALLQSLAPQMLFVLIESSEEDDAELARRFDRDPKPIYYNEGFLRELWAAYQLETSLAPDDINPDDFVRWGFKRLLARRRSGYRALADNWGVRLPRSALLDLGAQHPEALTSPAAFEQRFTALIAAALEP